MATAAAPRARRNPVNLAVPLRPPSDVSAALPHLATRIPLILPVVWVIPYTDMEIKSGARTSAMLARP